MSDERPRIGALGHPKEVWQVYVISPHTELKVLGFYDREKALAFVRAGPDRHLKTYPLPIEDA